MEAPLLGFSSGIGEQLFGHDGDYLPARSWRKWWKVICIETVKLWSIGGPIGLNIICQYGLNVVTSIFAGHLGNVELSAISISLSVIGTFSFGFLLGMGSALETLSGQAFGAGQVHMLGIYMQRSMIILFVTSIILTPLYAFATPLLKLLGQEDQIAQLAGDFSILIIPQLFSLVVAFPTQKFLQAQRIVSITAWIGFFTLPAYTFLLWLFIYEFGWGTTGAAVAYDIASWGSALAQLVYVIAWCKDGWRGWSLSAFRDIWGFVRLSIASAVMLCLEIWYMMSIIVLTGHLDNAVIAVGSLNICLSLNGLEAMIFIGINAAISVRVSNDLGLRHPRTAKYSVYITVSQSLLIGIICMLAVLAARNHFAVLFTNNKEMQQAVAHLAGLLAVTMVLNSVQPVISGVAIGAGWQALAAYINLGCYYIFGLPLGVLLGYVGKSGVTGLWGGMIAGTALQTVLLLIILYKTNWYEEVEQTSNRMRKWGGQDAQDTERPTSSLVVATAHVIYLLHLKRSKFRPMLPDQYRRRVEVTEISAKDLENINARYGKLRPFVELWEDRNEQHCSEVDEEGGTNPTWDQTFVIPFRSKIADAVLTLQVCHYDDDKREEGEGPRDLDIYVGTAQIRLQDIVDEVGLSNRTEKTIELQRVSGQIQGTITVKLAVHDAYRPKGPFIAPNPYDKPNPYTLPPYTSPTPAPEPDSDSDSEA